VEDIAAQIRAAHQTGLEIALVVGGGNFWRGVKREQPRHGTRDC